MAATLSTSLRGLATGPNRDRLDLILGHARFAIDRAAAHVEDPSDFPLPTSGDSLERVYAASFAGLEPGVRRRLARRARQRLEAARPDRVSYYGSVGELSATQPVNALVELEKAAQGQRYRITPAELERGPIGVGDPLRARTAAHAEALPTVGSTSSKRSGTPVLAGRRPRAAAGGAPTSLELFAETLRCIDDTREVGKDEISLAGVRQEARIQSGSGKLTVSRSIVGPIDLGKFTKGQARAINSALATFDLANTPKLCSFDLFLAETDVLKGFDKELREVLEFIPDRFDELLASVSLGALLTGAAPMFFPGSWPFYVVLLVVIASILLGNAIFIALRDDVFPSHQTGIPLSSPDFLFPGDARETARETTRFSKFGGTYELDFHWRLV